QTVRADAPPAGDLGAHAVVLTLLAEVRSPLPDGDADVHRRVEREQTHRPVATEHERADVALAHAVLRDQVERRLPDLLAVEGDRHVVELGRLEEPVDVVGVAEDRRADLGVVAADALEDARAVVQAVREYVDLCVLPCGELAVHPNEVRGLHVRVSWCQRCASTACVASAVLALPPRSGVRSPWSRALSTADSTDAAASGKPSPWRSIMAALRNIARGLAMPWPAMSGAEPWTGSKTPGVPDSPRLALGSIPIEPVSIAASSLRMSPNMFSVSSTSKWRGLLMSCMAALSTSTCSSRTSRPCSGRGRFGSVVSHLGPPTAPSRTASAARQPAKVSSGSGDPVASIAAPPIEYSENVKSSSALSTSTAEATTSRPIPSP